jgi:hypothetical protein
MIKFIYELKDVNGVPISAGEREDWINRMINKLLQEIKADKTLKYINNYTMCGDSFVYVSISRWSNGELRLSIEDCLRRRNVFYATGIKE